MNYLSSILDDGSEKKTIVETGFDKRCLFELAGHIQKNPQSELESISLDFGKLSDAHLFLEHYGLAAKCTFHLQDPLKFLQSKSWIDAVFLNSRNGLQYAVEEFRLAASTGAKLIVMTDYQTTSAHAIQEATKCGWTYVTHADYYILRRPQ